MLRHDVRLAISPQVGEWNGRQEVGDALRDGMTSLGQWRLLPIMANRQPGAAGYLRRPGQIAFVPFVLTVLRLQDGRTVETVLMPEDDRDTVCISSQVGCPVDCKFCMTALMGAMPKPHLGTTFFSFRMTFFSSTGVSDPLLSHQVTARTVPVTTS